MFTEELHIFLFVIFIQVQSLIIELLLFFQFGRKWEHEPEYLLLCYYVGQFECGRVFREMAWT